MATIPSNMTIINPADIAVLGHVDIEQHRIDATGDALLGDFVERVDSFVSSGGPFTRDELTAEIAKIFYTRYKRRKVAEIFNTNTSELRPGQVKYRTHRVGWESDVTIIGTGGGTTEVAQVTIARDYEDLPIIYYATKAAWNYLEQLADELMVSAVRSRAEKLKGARKALERFRDKIALSGLSDTSQFCGILDNPYISVLIPTGTAGIGGTDAERRAFEDAILQCIGYSTQHLEGHDGLEPDTFVSSPRVVTAMKMTTRTQESDTTIYQHVLAHTSIEDIQSDPSLKSAGPGGTDVMMSCSSDEDVIELMEAMPPTPLPEERRGVHSERLMVMGQGSTKVMEPLGVTKSYIEVREIS